MDFGLESHIYRFISNENEKGHSGDFILSKIQIKEFLDNGYSVVAFCMPLEGLNNQPTVFFNRFGCFKLTHHDHMQFLIPQNGQPIKYIVVPVVVILNYLERNYKYKYTAMVGISGGGWTTTLVVAIDSRIKYSFSVAGSYPIFLRTESK